MRLRTEILGYLRLLSQKNVQMWMKIHKISSIHFPKHLKLILNIQNTTFIAIVSQIIGISGYYN